MEEILFKSEGNPPKRKKMMDLCCSVIIICGVIMFIAGMALYGEVRTFCFVLGVAFVGAGVVMSVVNGNSSANKARLYLYENHIEGVQISPCKEFSVLYSEITEVQKVVALSNPILVIQSNKGVYTVLTDEIETAYKIVCDKVYGEV